MVETDSRIELSFPITGCFRFCGTVKRRSLPVTPAIFVFTNLALMAVAIGSGQPMTFDSKLVGNGGLPSSRIAIPVPMLYSRRRRLHGRLWLSRWSSLAPAAFFTMPLPTSALLHLAGTPDWSSTSVNAHLGLTLVFARSPSAPIGYFSMTVARFDGSVSPTRNPNTRLVGIGFLKLPLPFALVEALWSV